MNELNLKNIKINNKTIDSTESLSQEVENETFSDEETEEEIYAKRRRKKYFGKKSLSQYLWAWAGRDAEQNLIYLARLGDIFIKEAKEHALRSIARQLRLRVITRKRKNYMDYKIRKAKAKYRIGKNTFYLISYKEKK